jgi:hypothetical protein
MRNTELLNKIDAAIAEKNLLKHPFYQDWQAGKLSREALQLYAAQYYRHVEAFPKHLRVLAARTEGPIRDIVMENLAEEENPERPHPKLWREFAAALVWARTTLPAALLCRGRRRWWKRSAKLWATGRWRRRLRRSTLTKRRFRRSLRPRLKA